MRKIEKQMVDAVLNKNDFMSGNTAVYFISANESGNINGSHSEVFLHNNHIADYWHNSKELAVNVKTLARWPTVTTKSRVRALGANVTTKNYVTYLNGVSI